jgi:hypothetical protein
VFLGKRSIISINYPANRGRIFSFTGNFTKEKMYGDGF